MGGGDISVHDVGHLVDAGYPVFALDGSGSLADTLAADDPADDADVETLRASALVQSVPGFADPARLRSVLEAALALSVALRRRARPRTSPAVRARPGPRR